MNVARRLLLVTLVAALGLPASAEADATLTFDDLAAGATLTTQYQSRGVTFGSVASGQGQTTANVPVITNVGTQAQSGSQIGRINRRCLTAECIGTTEVWWQYTGGSRSRVSVSVGAFGTASNTITLTAFTINGTAISSSTTLPKSATVTGGTGFKTRLTFASLNTNIAFVRVRGSTAGSIGIDDITHDTPASAPSFTIKPRGATSLNVHQGSAAGIDMQVDRVNYGGTLRLSADPTTLPAGVTMTPVDTTSASQAIVRVTFRAEPAAALQAGKQVRIVAAPVDSKTPAPQATTITVNTVAFVDARVVGVEVTQGVQTLALPWVTASPAVKNYSGVPLYANGKTVVRVYANNGRFFERFGDTLAPVIRLHGVNATTGATLPLSPLLPQASPGFLAFNQLDEPPFTQRACAGCAYTFTLPASWTGTGERTTTSQPGFNLTLRAELVPQPSQIHLESNSLNNSMTLQRVNFTPTCCLDVATVRLTYAGTPTTSTSPRPIRTILREALNLVPLEYNMPDYQGTLDATQEYDDPELGTDGKPLEGRSVVASKLITFSQRDAKNDIVVGFGPKGWPDCSGGVPVMACEDDKDRPYTSSAHEFFHALGAVVEDATFSGCVDLDVSCHASRSCTALNSGTMWPPDEVGLIQGIGLDHTGQPPYRILASAEGVPSEPGLQEAGAVYDFMSYCAGDTNSWLGPKNWTDVLNRFARNASPAGSASFDPSKRARAAQAPATPKLIVNAIVNETGTVTVDTVHAAAGDSGEGSKPSPYALFVKDRTGAVIAQVPMRQRPVFAHTKVPSLVLSGVAAVPAARAGRVEIVRDDAVVAARDRSANAPRARFVRPSAGTLVGRGDRLAIQWQASDADNDRLDVIVEWSARGGKPGTWRDVLIGPNGGRVALPSEYFAGSDDAFLRLRVNDGFNETVVLSPRFRTIHRGPRVSITSPRAGARVSEGSTLTLSAIAQDERAQRLGRAGVRWLLGRREIGRGEQAAVVLSRGRHRIRVVATDARGRRATASMTVQVVAAKPQFERLSAPQRIGRSARRLTLQVAATVPARLTVAGDGVTRTRASVGRKSRRLTVRVRPGARALRLRLTLSAGGLTKQGVVTVAR